MKRIVRLTESDLVRIVKKTINENINKNPLYTDIKDILWDSYESKESKLVILITVFEKFSLRYASS
jgi:hypothetical protein